MKPGQVGNGGTGYRPQHILDAPRRAAGARRPRRLWPLRITALTPDAAWQAAETAWQVIAAIKVMGFIQQQRLSEP